MCGVSDFLLSDEPISERSVPDERHVLLQSPAFPVSAYQQHLPGRYLFPVFLVNQVAYILPAECCVQQDNHTAPAAGSMDEVPVHMLQV